MESFSNLIDQVRAVLIQSEDKKPRHEIYNQFINECKANDLTEDDFYKKVLKVAHKSIDWDYIEEDKKRKDETQKKLEAELAEQENLIQSAPIYIDRLIKTAFDDGVVEGDELKKIFNKATALSQDSHALAEKIDSLFDERNYKSYPKADLDAPTLRETLCSSNWYNEDHYTKLTTPPPPPPPPFPWKQVVVACVLILSIGGGFFYNYWYKPYLEDKNAKRYYSYVNMMMRSSQMSGVEYNVVQKLPYGTELLVYTKNTESGEWAYAKANDQKGYVGSQYILSKRNFYELNGIFADIDSRDAAETAKCRMALLKYFQDTISRNIMGRIDPAIQQEIYGKQKNKEIWQIFTRPKDIKPNAVAFARITDPNSKFTDFGCLIKNIATGKRKFLLFAFSETGEPRLVYETDAPDAGYIKSMSRSYNTIPIVRYSN